MLKKIFLSVFISSLLFACSEEDLDESLGPEAVNISLSIEEQQLLNMVNSYRTSRSLSKLQLNDITLNEAHGHSNYMLSKKTISHDNWDNRVAKINKKETVLALSENVAKNITIQRAFINWTQSTYGHKEALNGDYTHTGISIKKDDDGFFYLTQIFLKK